MWSPFVTLQKPQGSDKANCLPNDVIHSGESIVREPGGAFCKGGARMRRIAKLSLLLAPLLLASGSGCATPSFLSSSNKPDARVARIDRLLNMAADYENKGRPEAAMSIYEHVLAQHPENTHARQRSELLAQNGVTPAAPSRNKINLRNRLAPASPETLMATRRPTSPATPEKATAPAALAKQEVSPTQTHATSSETPAQTPATRQAEVPTLAEVMKPFPQIEKDLSASPLPEEIRSTNTEWTVARKDNASSSQESLDIGSDWTIAKSPSAAPEVSRVEMASSSTQTVTPAVNADAWHTTDLTRHEKTEPAVQIVDDAWERTRLVTLCDGLPQELVPFVKQLESSDPLIRVQGLQKLSEQGEQARAATVAVHALLEDSEAAVAVKAASTLREIANDAWSSVRTLTKHLKHEDPQIVRLSAYLLGQMGPEAMDAVPALEEVRGSGDLLSSLHAAEALTHIAPADRKSFSALSSALSNDDQTIRWFAAVSMGTVSDQCERDAVVALTKALKDSEPQVRAAACLSLGGLGEHALTVISELEEAARSESSEVQVAAETALACLRG